MTTPPPPGERAAADTQAEVVDAIEVDDDTATPRRRKRLQRQLIEWGVLLGSALLIALLIKTFLFQSFYIPSESMYPTLKKDDRVLINKLSYRLHDVNRGDIVVFEAPDGVAADDIRDFVKRVVGLPGETVEGRDGRIYVDGRLLEEPYLPDDAVSSDFGPVTVSDGHYWVLGDNRQNSKDSTYFGEIPGSDIEGRVFLKIWPPGDAGFI